MDGLIFLNGWISGKMDGKNGQMDRWKNGWKKWLDGKWINKRMEKLMNG